MAMRNKSQNAIAAGSRRSSVGSDGGSLCFSDAEDSWHSTNGSHDECRFSSVLDPEMGMVLDRRRDSSAVSECCSQASLGAGAIEVKVHSVKDEKDCRICHLSLESSNSESGEPIMLGCSCKDDLAAAHKHCAEAWFKIRGNKICEICGGIARNVATGTEPEIIGQPSETSNVVATTQEETRSFWRGHRFLNFLLACMVFAFAISWLFHFSVPS